MGIRIVVTKKQPKQSAEEFKANLAEGQRIARQNRAKDEVGTRRAKRNGGQR